RSVHGRPPPGDVPHAAERGAQATDGNPLAELAEQPFPPGEYPVVIVGSGPGGLQLSYALTHLGVQHAVISADPAPGGMFRRWPFFQRLLSWTKPFAPFERGTRFYERYDWNSLIPDDDQHRAIQPRLMDGSSYFPSRSEMEQNIATFARETGIRVRYECRWTGTARDGEGFRLQTTAGQYRARVVVFAFELANGFLPWARQIVLASPRPTQLSVVTNSLVGVRARYVQPYEDNILGGGVVIMNASIDEVARAGSGFRVRTTRSDGGGSLVFEADDVIATT